MGVGRDVLTDGVELCIECTRHCHGSSFPKLGGGETAHGRHTRVDVDAVMCAGVGPDGKPARTAEYAAPQWPVCGHAASVAGKTANGRQMPSHTSANARSISGGESRTRSATPSHEKGGKRPVSVAGKPHTVGKCRATRKRANAQWHAQARPVSVAGKPHTVGKCRATKRRATAQWQAQTRPVSVAGKPHTVGKCRSTKGGKRPMRVKGTSAQRQWQVKPHTVGIQHGSREGCPDGWRGALHRVHEALPREQLSEAC